MRRTEHITVDLLPAILISQVSLLWGGGDGEGRREEGVGGEGRMCVCVGGGGGMVEGKWGGGKRGGREGEDERWMNITNDVDIYM